MPFNLFKESKSVVETLSGVADAFHLSKEERLQFLKDQDIAQMAINEIEAKHESLFVAGARPTILWLCGIIIANNYLIVPYLGAVGVSVPVLPLEALWPVMMGLLGLGGMRTAEKMTGTNKNR